VEDSSTPGSFSSAEMTRVADKQNVNEATTNIENQGDLERICVRDGFMFFHPGGKANLLA